MITRKLLFYCYVLGLLAAVLPLRAQTATGINAQLSFLVVAGAPELKDAFFESTRQRTRVTMSASASSITGPVSYEGPASFIVYASGKSASPGQLSTALPIGRVELPRAPQVLILLGPGKEVPKAGEAYLYTALAIVDDWTSFPVGTVRVLNYSGKKVQASIGSSKVLFEAGPAKPLRIHTLGKAQSEFSLRIETSEPSGASVIYENPLVILDGQRMNVVITPRSRRGGPGANVLVTREFMPTGAAPRQSRPPSN
jgi:hypothetical protein